MTAGVSCRSGEVDTSLKNEIQNLGELLDIQNVPVSMVHRDVFMWHLAWCSYVLG